MQKIIHSEQKTTSSKNAKALPKELEIAVFHTLNGQLFRAGIISKDIYEKAKVMIDKL